MLNVFIRPKSFQIFPNYFQQKSPKIKIFPSVGQMDSCTLSKLVFSTQLLPRAATFGENQTALHDDDDDDDDNYDDDDDDDDVNVQIILLYTTSNL